MERNLPYLAVFIVILYALYNTFVHSPAPKNTAKPSKQYLAHIQKHTGSHLKEELQHIDTLAYTRQYIVNVINHGSSSLHFKPREIMEGGFASREDAPKIACYVMSLSGEGCKTSYPKDAPMYYSSNCAGCHGEDGKGLGGTYPDLTKRPLLGIAKRKEVLEHLLKGK